MPPTEFLDRMRAFCIKSAYRRKPKEASEFDDSDRAAIALSRMKIKTEPSAAPLVIFMISLVDRARAKDWGNVCNNLYRTIASLQLQSDPNWIVIICGGDCPDSLITSDRVIFLPHDRSRFPEVREIEPGTGDKGAKREQIIAFIEASFSIDGYAFAMDGDDLLHKDIVKFMRSQRHPSGYIIERGLKVDLQTGGIVELGPRGLLGTRRTPMWSTCGTGTGLYFDLRSQRGLGTRLIRVALLENHRRSPILATISGHGPKTIPFHGGVYLVNNGGNVTEWRVSAGQVTSKEGHSLREMLESGFSWSRIAEAQIQP